MTELYQTKGTGRAGGKEQECGYSNLIKQLITCKPHR